MKRNSVWLIPLCVVVLCAVSAKASEVQIDFNLVSGGGSGASSMITNASGISGNITWTAEYPAKVGTSFPTYYFMRYLIDDHIAEDTYDHYWMTDNPGFLRIDFSESVYISKIRTYNVVDNSGGSLDRWAESIISTSTDGVTFSPAGNIEVDATPVYTEYVDLYINAYVTSILFEDNLSAPLPGFYAINEIQMFTDNNPPVSVPEPASMIMVLLSCAGLLKKLKK